MASLPALLPKTAYSLAYTLPLLFVSIALIFAGCFLTLQRTRSFAPRNDAMQLPGAFGFLTKKKLPKFYLEGGIGGVGVGYAFGVHAATFLSLLIPNESTSTPLGANAFVAVWVLSCLSTAVLAGRFKYATFAFAGISGGVSLALAFCVAIHPPLLARRIIVALFVPVLTILTVLPFQVTQEPSLRLAMSATGAFGFSISVAILSNVPAWSGIWSRLWLDADITWGTNAERGISAGFWLLLGLGCLSDWFLKRFFGGNPDQKWDTYLAEYTTSLPQSDSRAGNFRPDTTTIWDRITHPFGHHPPKPSFEPVFAYSDDAKLPIASPPPFDEKAPFEYDKPRLLQKTSSERPIARLRALAREDSGRKHKREAVKFRPLGDAGSSDEDDEDDKYPHPFSLSSSPFLRRQDTQTSATKTLTNGEEVPELDFEKERTRILGAKKRGVVSSSESDPAPDYSDYEEDVTASAGSDKQQRDAPGWTPAFITRKSSGSRTDSSQTLVPPSSSTSSNSNNTLLPPGAVPLTPSLIRAIDRIAVAQSDAFGRPPRERQGASSSAAVSGDFSAPSTPGVGDEASGERWDMFWRDVTTRAGEGAKR